MWRGSKVELLLGLNDLKKKKVTPTFNFTIETVCTVKHKSFIPKVCL